MFERLLLLLNTIKYLKIRQIVYRIYYRFRKVKVNDLNVYRKNEYLINPIDWNGYSVASPSLFENKKARFLNKSQDISESNCWNAPTSEKLWLYNLHYMDDLNAVDSEDRIELHKSHILRWITENPAPFGNGWEPYTLSLRLVNLVKWCLKNTVKNQEIIASIHQQGDALLQQVEYHILANHLFANGKALFFVGCFFGGEIGQKFKRKGLEILIPEFHEQFLFDGGHFERSPMYHSVMLWDVLETIDIARHLGNMNNDTKDWERVAVNGVSWLEAMCHPDGEISFFNDGAMGIAAKLSQILDYAEVLNLQVAKNISPIRHLKHSGFTSMAKPNAFLVVNHAPIGPTYQPGHAHADTLSFELSVFGERVFVNSGTSCYGDSVQRLKERETKSHNTVVVNSQNSSEVWDGFRVARRASVLNVNVSGDNTLSKLKAEHDGYNRFFQNLNHERVFSLSEKDLAIQDNITLSGQKSAAYYYLSPDVKINIISQFEYELSLISSEIVRVISSNAMKLKNSEWYPEFGVVRQSKVIIVDFEKTQLMKIKWRDIEKS
ncbi:alginate lyase family protein [Brumicola pallidula]|uniref:Uncharacterized protein n=1 Tax=Brumicola pallidula DSM 14239 = ACAM 615 TaxID=1121922 RepID=K6ZHQ4_9ALTE|nr:alginate lyase family protein [Glaciecola pallidula]GAC29872.1 hypothetical protein GPAL_3021 [Glaciecola pallidula DSM 14239 = ACAM 615]